ncbi:MAG: DJ-1/PfpI family protein [Nanoarchaeota archaeon]|nr:DJ-1/PfpI family protein [Nanoarchaeota archaeon]
MKILMVIAQHGFQDHEFEAPLELFKEKKIPVKIASQKRGTCFGKFGLQVNADLSFSDVKMEDFSAIVLIGGPGSVHLVGNKELERILHEAVKQEKIIAAICYSPVTLAKAGLLRGKKATVWNEDGNQQSVLEEAGAEYLEQAVVIDGRLITANGPNAASRFGEEIAKMLGF